MVSQVYVFGINIITIATNKKSLPFTLPDPKLVKSKDSETYSKYMFIYNSGDHFELITFFNENKKRSTIFNTNQVNIIPPLYIIFVIYGAFYFNITNKTDITLFQKILESIDKSVSKITSPSFPLPYHLSPS